MHFFRRLGMEGVAWSLRRLYCPVGPASLVLEVGSGGNPYARANVLLDAYEETRERHWVPLRVDRPFVFGRAERLPFRDGSFDFVIASHVVEHSPWPERVLGELQRVARAGYIEVPDAFMERVNPYRDHRVEITLRDEKLLIRKKPAAVVDADLVGLYENRVKAILTRETMRRHPFEFHVRYYWRGRIDFAVLNPEIDATWKADETGDPGEPPPTLTDQIRQGMVNGLRALFSQRGRNARLDLATLLMCPACSSVKLVTSVARLTCAVCDASYEVRNGVPLMFLPEAPASR